MADFNLEDLKKPFRPDQLDWRVQGSGETNGNPWAKVLVYVNARAVFDRLDEAVGPENWKNTAPVPVHGTKTMYKGTRTDYKSKQEIPAYSDNDHSITNPEAWDTQNGCLLGFNMGIAIRINGEWVERWDGSHITDYEPYKGGISSAWKRAAVPWGIGRYLYSFGESWAIFNDPRCAYSTLSDKIYGKWRNWLPPLIADEFLPEGWSGDQYAHLMGPGFVARQQPAPAIAASAPEVLTANQANGLLQQLIRKTTDLRNKAAMASDETDRQEIRSRVATAKEFFGQKFADTSISKTELDQLTMLLKSVEDTLEA